METDNTNAAKDEPQLNDLLGHFFDGAEVHMIFREPDGRQFHLLAAEPGARVHCNLLEPGQTWARRDGGLLPQTGSYCDERKAIHEAGHAVICADEGIKIEYVTVIAHDGPLGMTFHGRCRYDYRLTELLEAHRAQWGVKLVRANLGGPEAERIFWERKGSAVPDDYQQGWALDLSGAKDEIITAASGSRLIDMDFEDVKVWYKAPQVLEELERQRIVVRERLLQPHVWEAVRQVAIKLMAEGAVDGQVATRIIAACLGK
jgi:hypothetical protein